MKRVVKLGSIAATALLSLSACIVTPAHVSGPRTEYPVVMVAPPPPQVEVVSPPPSPDVFWQPGYWGWQNERHLWVAGHWERHRQGAHWVPHRWERDERGGWRMREGHWRRD
jgi:hypothetical protein